MDGAAAGAGARYPFCLEGDALGLDCDDPFGLGGGDPLGRDEDDAFGRDDDVGTLGRL
jgi:hypothetical protein